MTCILSCSFPNGVFFDFLSFFPLQVAVAIFVVPVIGVDMHVVLNPFQVLFRLVQVENSQIFSVLLSLIVFLLANYLILANIRPQTPKFLVVPFSNVRNEFLKRIWLILSFTDQVVVMVNVGLGASEVGAIQISVAVAASPMNLQITHGRQLLR